MSNPIVRAWYAFKSPIAGVPILREMDRRLNDWERERRLRSLHNLLVRLGIDA